MGELKDFEYKIAKLELSLGDIVVIKFSESISDHTVKMFSTEANRVLAAFGARAMIIGPGVDIQILTAAEIASRV